MTTIAFDSLQYARRLRAAGVPESQAEVQAELMAEAFGFYASNIVTKDYLDEVLRARFAEQNLRLEHRFAEVNGRFNEIDGRFNELDGRFNEMNGRFAGINEPFAEVGERITLGAAQINGRLTEVYAELDGRMTQGFTEIRASLRQLTWMVGGTWLLIGYPLLTKLLESVGSS